MTPRVTATIITFPGGEKYLQEAIDSVNDQTFKDFKLIVVNDERSGEIKWNQLIEECDTEYLWLFHHDDVAMPNFLEVMIKALDERPQACAAFCLDYVIDSNGKRLRHNIWPFKVKDVYTYRDVMGYMARVGNVIRMPSFVMRMSLAGHHRLDKKTGTAGDTALWFRMLKEHPIIILPDKLFCYREHPESDTQKNVVGTHRIWDHGSALEESIKLLPNEVPWYAYTEIGFGQAQRAEAYEIDRLQNRLKKSQKIRFVIAHEPPYNAGTGVLAAERVKRFNEQDNEWYTWYVFPQEDANANPTTGMVNGVPALSCNTMDYKKFIERHGPSFIEIHHILRWPLELLGIDRKKSLWLHDATLWCPKFHMYDGEGMCTGPTTEKCAKCVNVNTSDIKARKDYIASTLPSFDQVICNSKWTADWLLKEFEFEGEVSTPVMPEMVPHPKRKRIGFFGGFYPVKGIDTILEAMKQLPEYDLMMYSHGIPSKYMDGIRMRGYDNVFCMGGYKRSDLPVLVNLVDLCVVPSLMESYGLVARELMACGAKVICSTAGGMAEIGTFEPGNVTALVQAIKEVPCETT